MNLLCQTRAVVYQDIIFVRPLLDCISDHKTLTAKATQTQMIESFKSARVPKWRIG